MLNPQAFYKHMPLLLGWRLLLLLAEGFTLFGPTNSLKLEMKNNNFVLKTRGIGQS